VTLPTDLTFYLELGLEVLLAFTLCYCVILEVRLKRAQLHIDELSVLTASGERIAQRMEGAAASPRIAKEIPDMPLPSTSILSRLERAVQ